MATGQRRLTTASELGLLRLPVAVALRMLTDGLRPEPVEGRDPVWHPEYPLADSLDAIAMALAAHEAMTGAIEEPPAWWIHQIVAAGVVVGDIGFHGPLGCDGVVEIGYCVVPAWRGRGVATRACGLILQRAWQDGAEIVIAEADHDNVASQAVLMSNGFCRLAFTRSRRVFMINRPEAR